MRKDYQGTVFADRENYLSPKLWFGLPVALLIVSIVILLIDGDMFVWWARSEDGPGENITAILFVISGVLAFVIARKKDVILFAWLRGGFYTIGAVGLLVAGEEWSWGQHFFNWQTPEWLASVNKQRETNLHNAAENLLDQKPRAVFTFAALLFGFFVPLLRPRLRWLDRYPVIDWLLPGRFLIPTTLVLFLPRVVERVQFWTDTSLTGGFIVTTRDYQELQELLMAVFVFLYLANILLRIRRHRDGNQSAGSPL
ncbi:MAG: hypothetical protein RIM72_16945 [Alphaproteobacteria bacterium]